MNFFNRFARKNNNNISNFEPQNMGVSNYIPELNNTLNLPVDYSYFSNVNFNPQSEEVLRR